MKLVNTDLNSPWQVYPGEEPGQEHIRQFPNQYKFIPDELAERLEKAWDALMVVDGQVEAYTEKKTVAQVHEEWGA